MHVITNFIEISNQFPHRSITNGISTLHFTYLTMNISRFHISCIQKTDNRAYFTVGGTLDHHEHFKLTEQYVTLSAFVGLVSVDCQEMREDSAHARTYDLNAAAEIFEDGTYFSTTLRQTDC
jgi:hypothetical protein